MFCTVSCLSGCFLVQAAFPWYALSTLPGKISHSLGKQLLYSIFRSELYSSCPFFFPSVFSKAVVARFAVAVTPAWCRIQNPNHLWTEKHHSSPSASDLKFPVNLAQMSSSVLLEYEHLGKRRKRYIAFHLKQYLIVPWYLLFICYQMGN